LEKIQVIYFDDLVFWNKIKRIVSCLDMTSQFMEAEMNLVTDIKNKPGDITTTVIDN
jgi:hypothetical protein